MRPLNDPPVAPYTHRAQAHIKVGERDREKTAPRKQHVTPVQTTHTVVDPPTSRSTRQTIAKTADQMAKRVATEGVAAEQHEVRQQNDSAETHAKPPVEPERIPHVARQNDQKHQGQVKEIAVDI